MPCEAEPRVYPRPGGVWYYDLREPGHPRERRWGGLTREAAVEAARRRLRELRGEPEPEAPAPVVRTAPGSTLGDLLPAWVTYLRELHHRKPATWKTAQVSVTPLLRHLGREGDARTLEHQDLVAYIGKRRKGEAAVYRGGRRGKTRKTVSDQTILRELRALRSALRWAVKQRLLRELPCEIPMPRVERKHKEYLRPEQVHRLLDACGEHAKARALLAACFYGVLRRDEALHLRWSGISLDAEEGYIRVLGTGDWSPKTHQEREVPLNDRLREELLRWREQCPADSEWVFPSKRTRLNPDGRWCSPDKDLRPIFDAFVKTEGVKKPRQHVHWLRGCMATELMVEQGVDPVTTAELGGWSDVAVMFKHYASSNPKRKRAAIQKVGRRAS